MKLKNSSRASNIELLRIVLMVFIIIYHFMLCVIDECDSTNNIVLSLFNILHIGVPCFVLISGYFGIKANVRKIVSFYLMCTFYSVTIYLICSLLNNSFSVVRFLESFFSISHSQRLWFVPCYFFLILISPLLNAAIDFMNKKQLIQLVLAFSILSFYYGLIWRLDVNVNGKNIINFMLLYLMGATLRKYALFKSVKKEVLLFSYILMIALIILGQCLIPIDYFRYYRAFTSAYNSPILISSAVLFFLIFQKMQFSSKFINNISSSAFAIYLIHENENLAIYYRRLISYLYDNVTLGIFFLCVLIAVACIIVLSIIVDKLRVLMMKNVDRFIVEKCESIYGYFLK